MITKIKKLLIHTLRIGLIIPFIAYLSVPAARGADPSLNVNLVGNFAGGTPRDVIVQGNYAYVAADSIFSIIDVSDPLSPKQISYCSIPGVAYGVHVSGNYAYVADMGNALRIIDITNPLSPSEVGSLQTAGQVYDVYAVNNYAYVVDHTNGLRIIDITNPASPTEVGMYPTPGGMLTSVYVTGNNAYITDQINGLRIIDITNPALPSQVGFCFTPGHVLDVYVAGNYAYVGDGGTGLRVINITNLALPVEVGFYDTPGFALGVYVSGNYACVADGNSGLRIINISNPAVPSAVGAYNTPGSAQGIYVAGNIAYVADITGGLRIINISNPVSPLEIGRYDTPNSAFAIHVSGNYAYAVDFDRGVSIIDITNPAVPFEVGFYNTPGQNIGADDVYAEGNYAYVSDRSGWLRVVDISNPASPSEVGSHQTPDQAHGVYVAGNYAYLTNSSNGIRIIDISNPSVPFEAGFYDTPGVVGGVYVKDNYAYVADYGYGLRIIDITNPALTSEVGFCDTPGIAVGVYVTGNYAYVADFGYGLRIIDITDPAAPFEAGFYNTSSNAVNVAVSGNYAYIADYADGLRVIDISNPDNPLEIGFYEPSGNKVRDVYFSNNLAYVADAGSGVWILQPININEAPDTPAAPSGPASGETGISYSFTAVTTDPDNDQVQYQFDWGDGTPVSAYTPLVNSGVQAGLTHTYTSPGIYSVQARARDEYNELTIWSAMHTITISSRDPNKPSTPAGPATGDTGIGYSFSTSAVDPDNDQVQYQFDWGDGTPVSAYTPLVNSGAQASLTHTYATEGPFTILSRAMDEYGQESVWSDAHSITISDPPLINNAPNIPATPGGPAGGFTQVSYTFSATTTDPDNDQVQYQFDWGDGTTSSYSPWVNSGVTITQDHTYATPGTYVVTSRAKDTHNAESNWSAGLTLVIVNRPPDKPITPSGSLKGKTNIPSPFSTSAADPDGNQVQYLFDWGDGTTSGYGALKDSGVTVTENHTYSTIGTFIVRSRARDIYQAESAWSDGLPVHITYNINQSPNKPSVPAGTDVAVTGIQYSFSTSAKDPEGDQLQYRFDWGDGTPVSVYTPLVNSGVSDAMPHIYNTPGTYYVKAQAKDIYGFVSVWSDKHAIFVITFAQTLNNAICYPNPYNPKKAMGGKLKIINLPPDAELTIYTIAGELVTTLYEKDFGNLGWIEWNGRNDDNNEVAQGIYLYHLQADSSHKTGKLAVIKQQ